MSEMEVTEGQLLSQDFGVGGPPTAAEVPLSPVDSGKTPDILAAEIRTIKNQTGRMVLNASIEVGRRLTEAKAKLPHGSWGEYLKNEVDYSPSQAQNLMRVFREYGSDQQSLFGGEAKSQTFGNLTYSKALSLLAIPDEEERERFAVENDVEHMSVRELNEALASRFVVIQMPAISPENLDRLLKHRCPELKQKYRQQFVSLFFDLQKKCEGGEISSKALDLRGLLDTLELMAAGVPSGPALDMGITNKTADGYEQGLIRDVMAARVSPKLTRGELFGP